MRADMDDLLGEKRRATRHELNVALLLRYCAARDLEVVLGRQAAALPVVVRIQHYWYSRVLVVCVASLSVIQPSVC